ncbi:MAG: flagellar basal body-associated FliL family protein [Deltaproteobacteria bacterium]|nr:flagellar basal body-associated FliL family protein [Deltaproteobacteria bacterium]
MAKDEGKDDHGGGAAKPKLKLPDTQTLLVLVNSLLVVVALGTMVYTKLIYQRPVIVEETEMKKAVEAIKKPEPPAEHAIINFDQITVNIAMTSGKAHYATVAFAVECRDSEIANIVKVKKALFTDRLIAALGHRQLTELNTIQGKLLLKTEIMREFNTLAPVGGITDMFFANFILQ